MISTRSIVFLLILLSVVLFLMGINMGKQIEKRNKIVATLTLSPPPTQSPSPTSFSLSYETYIHPDCGINFLYPHTLREQKLSSTSATLSAAGEKIHINCSRTDNLEYQTMRMGMEPDRTALIGNQKINIFVINNDVQFQIRNTLNGKPIIMTVSKNLEGLLIKTMQLSK